MNRRLLRLFLLAALLLGFSLLMLLASGWLPAGQQQPHGAGWDAPHVPTIPPSPSPTHGWWHEITPPTALSPTPSLEKEKP